MKLSISRNSVITLLCHFTQREPDDFKLVGGIPQFRLSKKPELWYPFFLPVPAVVAWQNCEMGYVAPSVIDIDPENLYYTDWNRKGIVFPIKVK